MEQTLASQSEVPAVICLGIAGVDRAEDAAVIRGIMRRIGHKAPALVVKRRFPDPGLFRITVTATDAAGNVTTVTRSVRIKKKK